MPADRGFWTALDQAVASGALRMLDRALARFLAEQVGNADATALLLAALASRQLGAGHSCLLLGEAAPLATEAFAELPALDRLLSDATMIDLRERLLGSGFVAADDNTATDLQAPLVLAGERLYLRRYWRYERDAAAAIGARLSDLLPSAPGLAAELDRLFPASDAVDPIHWPKVACAIAARSAFTIITGGPGTGKTTTVVRLLGLLQTLQLGHVAATPLRIRLAAPTGKAAARLNDSIAKQVTALDVDDVVRASIPADVITLHRLLGSRPDTRHYRHHRANPLHIDVLVIDEASMVDLEMMSAVLDALPASARLILLGDKDQLASVEAGAVLGDLCARADAAHYSAATANWLRDVGAAAVDAFVDDEARPLDQAIVMLRHSHRFKADSGIGRLAAAVNRGNGEAALAILDDHHVDLAWLADVDAAQIVETAIEGDPARSAAGYRNYLEHLQHGVGVVDQEAWAAGIIDAFGAFQLLCALRAGPFGVAGLNEAITTRLGEYGLIASGHEWYAGRPVLVTRNDYSLGLMNGDVGIALPIRDSAGESRLRVAFKVAGERGTGSRLRLVAPSRLSQVETAFAMTVHKSQGSEFGHCALALPDRTSTALTRELLYTGITRARDRFTLVGARDVIALAVATPTRRHSGLQAQMLAPP